MPISVDIYSWLNILTEESVQILFTKRKQSVLSREKRQTILSCMEKGKKALNLASEFGISKQPISSILKNQENMDPFAHTFQTSNGHQRKSLELAKNKELDRSVYAWFIQEHFKGTPV